MSWWMLLLVWLVSPRHTEHHRSVLSAVAGAAASITGARWAWRKAGSLFVVASRLLSKIAALSVWLSVWISVWVLIWTLSSKAARSYLNGVHLGTISANGLKRLWNGLFLKLRLRLFARGTGDRQQSELSLEQPRAA